MTGASGIAIVRLPNRPSDFGGAWEAEAGKVAVMAPGASAADWRALCGMVNRARLLPDLLDALDAKDAEIALLKSLVDGRFKDAAKCYLASAGPRGDGAFGFEIKAGIIPIIVEYLAASFKEMGGENYVQMEFGHDELGPLMVTLQRKEGELPGAIANREKDRADKAETERDTAWNEAIEAAAKALQETASYAGDPMAATIMAADANFVRELRR